MRLDVSAARSFLFVPGDRPERFDKAIASGADVVVIDLEDAVAPEAKSDALAHALAWLAGGGQAAVRVNGAGTPGHDAEIAALATTGVPVMLPKSESGDAVTEITAALGDNVRVIALIETARGVRDADAVAKAKGVARLAIGNVDLSAELGVDAESYAALAYARGRIVMASAAAEVPSPIDGVTTALDSFDAISADLDHARELGFSAKLCIHPRQVRLVNASFAPTPKEVEWARRLLRATSGGVSVFEGKMVDAPVIRRAEGILARE